MKIPPANKGEIISSQVTHALVVVLAVVLIVCGIFLERAIVSSDDGTNASYPSYVDDRLIIFTDNTLSRDELEEYLVNYGGTIYNELDGIDIYYVALENSYTYEELADICEQLEQREGIDSAHVDWEVEISFDETGETSADEND